MGRYQRYFIILAIHFLFIISILKPLPLIASYDPVYNIESQEPLLYTAAHLQSIIFNNYIYSFGGGGEGDIWHSDILRSALNNNGNLSTWTKISDMPNRQIWHTVVNKLNHIYLLGGAILDPSPTQMSSTDSVYHALINNDGNLSDWTLQPLMPDKLLLGGSIIYGDWIYFFGGARRIPTSGNFDIQSGVYRSKINSDGTIENWDILSPLPENRALFSIFLHANRILIAGGDSILGNTQNTVYTTTINSDGSLNSWESLNPLPIPLRSSGFTSSGKYYYLLGGFTSNGNYSPFIYYSKIDMDGKPTTWEKSLTTLPIGSCCTTASYLNSYIYLLGGHNPSYSPKYFSTTSKITLSEQNETPITRNVIFIPGLGASWNTESILNCEPDNTDEGWSLAPYADDIYNPLISSLTDAGWEVETYNYDWRRNIASHSAELTSLMDNLGLESGEKVNFVGHSMGGLLGRSYLEETSQESNKIDKYLSVGTPHKGTPLAYYPWAGAKIDTGNLLENIALNILIKHCQQSRNDKLDTLHKMIPSLQDLLPIEDYLKHYKSGELLPVESMSLKNQWLKDTFPSYGSIIGTLSGIGQQTLEFIRYKDRNKHEKNLNYWQDGKPTGKDFTFDGDGTITLKSSQLSSAVNIEPINQTHQGLVTSSEGISNILNFFNPDLNTTTLHLNSIPDPNSALVIISYPGKIWSLDPDWGSKKDKDYMISFINPKNGSYKLGIFPESDNTLLIVAQFLPNGNVLYKEYKLKGKLPKFKVLNFNSSNPREDILD